MSLSQLLLAFTLILWGLQLLGLPISTLLIAILAIITGILILVNRPLIWHPAANS